MKCKSSKLPLHNLQFELILLGPSLHKGKFRVSGQGVAVAAGLNDGSASAHLRICSRFFFDTGIKPHLLLV